MNEQKKIALTVLRSNLYFNVITVNEVLAIIMEVNEDKEEDENITMV
jgi:hypothetical protein